MENKFENFESFLKEQVNGYRMYPSGKVWVKVHDQLHGKRRFTIGAVIAMLVVGILLFLTENINRKTIANKENRIAVALPSDNQNNSTGNNLLVSDMPDRANGTKPGISSTPALLLNEPVTENRIPQNRKPQNAPTGFTVPANRAASGRKQTFIAETAFMNENTELETTVKKSGQEQDAIVPESRKTEIVLPETEEHSIQPESNPTAENNTLENIKPVSVLIAPEQLNKSLLNKPFAETDPSIFINSNGKKIRIQYYATPSISYRSLFDSRQKNNNINTGGVSDLDKSVFHKPALGLEAGVNWLFSLDNRLRVKSGVQFNYNRYNIKATSSQPEINTISLFGSARDITSVSTLRNDNGFYPKWVENSNLQFSVPVGLEFTLANGKNVQLTLGSSIQPSLLLKNKMYLLSTDLKNYMQEPSLIRRFNINGNIETFITVNTKNARWHIGPQLRYQILSTYEKKYPFKENLFDYGFKIGFSRPLK